MSLEQCFPTCSSPHFHCGVDEFDFLGMLHAILTSVCLRLGAPVINCGPHLFVIVLVVFLEMVATKLEITCVAFSDFTISL